MKIKSSIKYKIRVMLQKDLQLANKAFSSIKQSVFAELKLEIHIKLCITKKEIYQCIQIPFMLPRQLMT